MTDPCLVSVCIPTYNGARYLHQCLDSIATQTWPHLEIIIVDDASSDETVQIIQEYAARDGRIRLLRNEHNLGLVANWNRCVEHSTGEWVKFLFQDDFLHPDCIRRLVELNAQAVAVCHRDYVFENVGDAVRTEYTNVLKKYSMEVVFPGVTQVSAADFCNTVMRFGTGNFIGEPTVVMIRRSVFVELGAFDERFIQLCDLEFFIRAGIRHGISCVAQTLAYFRVHDQSTTAANQGQRALAKNVIDPLLLRDQYANNPLYQPLRDAALAHGIDLREQFQECLRYEQSWGKSWSSPEWGEYIRKYPQFKMPVRQQLKKLLRQFADRFARRGTPGESRP